MCMNDWNMTLNMLRKSILGTFNIKKRLWYPWSGTVLVWMIDLGIGWLERHETISKKIIDLFLWPLSINPSGTIRVGILLFGKVEKCYLFLCLLWLNLVTENMDSTKWICLGSHYFRWDLSIKKPLILLNHVTTWNVS